MGAGGRVKPSSGMEGEENRKDAPLAGGTFDLDRATVGLSDGSGDAEAKAGAPFAP